MNFYLATRTILLTTHLFTGTIAENIAYGRADATREEILEAARIANVDSFVYCTLIGRGRRRSDGRSAADDFTVFLRDGCLRII